MNENEVIDKAYAFLRGHTTAGLRFDEHLQPIKYVIAPDGRLIAPVMVAMLQAVDTVLFVPDFEHGAMELQVTLEQFEERGQDGAAADRWRIYHGEPPDVRWAYLSIDTVRYEGLVIDGEALMRPNPLAAEESRLCREMNQQHTDDLRRVCTTYANMEIEQPVMVGIDPLGFDVRARFDVVRVNAIRPMHTLEQARQTLAAMIAAAADSSTSRH